MSLSHSLSCSRTRPAHAPQEESADTQSGPAPNNGTIQGSIQGIGHGRARYRVCARRGAVSGGSPEVADPEGTGGPFCGCCFPGELFVWPGVWLVPTLRGVPRFAAVVRLGVSSFANMAMSSVACAMFTTSLHSARSTSRLVSDGASSSAAALRAALDSRGSASAFARTSSSAEDQAGAQVAVMFIGACVAELLRLVGAPPRLLSRKTPCRFVHVPRSSCRTRCGLWPVVSPREGRCLGGFRPAGCL